METKPVIKYGIDWTKIAIEVNDERKRIIDRDLKSSSAAFNWAYLTVMNKYSAITGEAWKEGRKQVGKIMAGWKKEKDEAKQMKPSTPPFTRLVKSIAKDAAQPVLVVKKSKEHIFLVLNGKFEATFTKTEKGHVSGSVRRFDQTPCLQSEVPFTVLKNARAVAQAHFHGDKRTGKLF